MVLPDRSASTSYWSITEGPDHPHLLSPAPGPSGRKPRMRASRPGLSRIPGRDHRRYYHEYWRSEYLMDFDPQRHGMICMVCGSSLATLKLSTIKRHIRQKHPDSLLWSPADKEVIRSGWECHLGLVEGQRSHDSDDALPQQEGDPLSPPSPEGETPQLREEERHLSGPSAQTLERYLNDSLHAWFRQEFLMEYEAERGRLLCMVCGAELPSLHLDHIKSHVLNTHANSLVYSSEEKHCILQAWALAHVQHHPPGFLKLIDMETSHINACTHPSADGTLMQDTALISVEGGIVAPQQEALPLRHPRRRRLRVGDPWRLRLDYLVAYGPRGQGTFCMVCSQILKETKVSSFRRHIQESHPETTTLTFVLTEMLPSEADDLHPTEDTGENASFDLNKVKKEETGGKSRWRDSSSRHGHYPGKDQRRNYQVRWRMDYLMDYDCRRHGLICMVCGATLATLKVSTIKRHIQQVHPHSVDFSPEQRQLAMLSYSQSAQHFIHADDCFSSQDHGHTELEPSPAHEGT
uniref:SPIN-DOC-like zinc-finger domain-containing protein n=1 Tax=Gouania willdenowi TaxID=441366 RepID=A0A8C5G8R5_GOUWI